MTRVYPRNDVCAGVWLSLLERYDAADANDHILGQGREGKPPRQEAIRVAFGRLMRSIGLDGVTHHVLRHTGGPAMVATGISLRVVQDIGGWSTLRMLERYLYPSGAEMSRAVRVLTPYRHKSRHSAEKRSPRVEEARSRKWCEIGSCDLASPTGTGVSYHADFQRIWVSDRKAA